MSALGSRTARGGSSQARPASRRIPGPSSGAFGHNVVAPLISIICRNDKSDGGDTSISSADLHGRVLAEFAVQSGGRVDAAVEVQFHGTEGYGLAVMQDVPVGE